MKLYSKITQTNLRTNLKITLPKLIHQQQQWKEYRGTQACLIVWKVSRYMGDKCEVRSAKCDGRSDRKGILLLERRRRRVLCGVMRSLWMPVSACWLCAVCSSQQNSHPEWMGVPFLRGFPCMTSAEKGGRGPEMRQIFGQTVYILQTNRGRGRGQKVPRLCERHIWKAPYCYFLRWATQTKCK